MSEGLSTGSAPAPASNGAKSATTAPAPGTTSAPVTPKNGEGAVAAKPAAGVTTPTEPSWKPLKVKLQGNDRYAEEEVEFPDEDSVRRLVLKGKIVDRLNKEKLALEESRRSEAARLKSLGFDPSNPDAYFQKRLEEEARRAQMPEQDRRIEDERRARETAEQRAAQTQQQLRQILEEQAETRAWGELEPRLKSAMTQHQMIGDAYAMESISQVAQEFINAGMDVPPEQVVAEAAARDKERFEGRLTKLEPKMLWAKLAPDTRKELLAIGVAEWKASRGVQSATPAPAPQKPQAPKEYLTPYEAARRRNGG